MENVKNKIRKFTRNEYFPFVILTIVLLLFHIGIHVGKGDDEWFSNVLSNNNLFEWIVERYRIWTSRCIIEFFLIIIVKCDVLWKILDTFIMVLGAVSISKIFNYEKSSEINWVICAFILSLPATLYSSTGWITTTINYSWVAFLGLFAMLPIKKILNHEKIKSYEYVFYTLALLYAANQEQMSCVLLAVYFIFTCYFYYKERKLNYFLILANILNLASLIFIITCPGNAIREGEDAAAHWVPNFNDISLFKKLGMGYSSTLFEYIINPNSIFFIFSFLLFICSIIKFKDNIHKFIASIPIAFSLIFNFLINTFVNTLDEKYYLLIKNKLDRYNTQIKFFEVKPQVLIVDIILLFICISILITLYNLFDNKKYSALTIFILLLGFGSRMAMSFSSTIYASGQRTFLFMYLAILICSVIFYSLLQKQKNKAVVTITNYVILIMSLMFFINMLYGIFSYVNI